MKNINQKLLSILFSLVLVLSATIFSFAENGDGSGGGQGNPVTIQSISINDGATNVELKPYIVINFSKNVINMSVKGNNKNCFSMEDENGNKISLNVIMADDQVEPEKKRIISLTPQNKLKEGKQYTLYISQNITSKSGDKLDSSRSISFKTKKAIEVSKDEEDNDATKPSNTTNTNNNTTNSNNNTTSSTVKEEISKDNDKDKGNKDTEDKKDDNQPVDDEKTTDKEDKKNNSEKETEEKQESNNNIEKSSNNNVDLAVNNEQIKEEKKTNLVPIITVGSAVVVIGAYIYIKKVRK